MCPGCHGPVTLSKSNVVEEVILRFGPLCNQYSDDTYYLVLLLNFHLISRRVQEMENPKPMSRHNDGKIWAN